MAEMSEFASSKPAAAPSIPPTQTPDAKILTDLASVVEKINLCTSMLQPLTHTSQVDENDSLLTIIGFLEACVPRVRELVEAGMTGALDEDTVVKCLAVNDSLCQVLEFVEHPEKCNASPASASAAVEAPIEPFDAFGIADDGDLFGDEDKKPKATVPSTTSAVASSTLDDLLSAPGDDLLSSPSGTAQTNGGNIDEKEFDDFFKE